MRTLAVLSLLALFAPSAARADEPDPLDLPKQVQSARDRWTQCTAAAAKGILRTKRSAAEIADFALRQCQAQERVLSRALTQQLGPPSAARVIELVRETDRSNLIRAIEEVRAKP